MKKLFLIRHAKSSWKNPDLADRDRPLNKRGKRDAPVMGKRLKECKAKPDLIISSPAKRALKTANIIAGEIDFPKKMIVADDIVYEGSVSNLLGLVQGIEDSFAEVMLFGHNPEITMLAELLTGKAVANIPTCGVFCVRFDVESWKEISKDKGSLDFFDYPKKDS